MSKQVEFLFDVGSPTAYLAYTQLPAIANNADAEVLWTPILLGGLFKAVGNQSPAFLPPKAAWMKVDLPQPFGPTIPVRPGSMISSTAPPRGAALSARHR